MSKDRDVDLNFKFSKVSVSSRNGYPHPSIHTQIYINAYVPTCIQTYVHV